MKKFSVLSFSFIVTALTAYGLVFPNYLLQELMSFSEPFILARLGLLLILLMYVFFSKIRLKGMRYLLFLASLTALSFGVSTLVSPMLFGKFNDYVPIGDVFIFIEGGIIGLLMAAELPVIESQTISPQLVKQIKVVQYNRLINQGF